YNNTIDKATNNKKNSKIKYSINKSNKSNIKHINCNNGKQKKIIKLKDTTNKNYKKNTLNLLQNEFNTEIKEDDNSEKLIKSNLNKQNNSPKYNIENLTINYNKIN